MVVVALRAANSRRTVEKEAEPVQCAQIDRYDGHPRRQDRITCASWAVHVGGTILRAELFDHLVGVGKRLARARNWSSSREMLNARWQYCPSAHLFLPDRRHRGRKIPVVEAPNRNAKLIWT